MPWDPKPAPPPVQQIPNGAASLSPATNNGLSSQYAYDHQGNVRIKTEPGTEQQYGGLPNGYPQYAPPPQGGAVRAAQLAQDYQTAHQLPRGGLALPGQRPQGLQLPPQQTQQQYSQQQQQYMQRSQAALQQQQQQPRIKVENDSPQTNQGGFHQQQQQQRQPHPTYAQTDGADEGLEEWQRLLAERRAAHAKDGQRADRMMRDVVMQSSSDLQSGLMMPLDEQPNRAVNKKRRTDRPVPNTAATAVPSVPQLDGDVDEDEKPTIKNEDDENAINSDLDDTDDEGAGAIGDDDEDFGDTILCTYDKVQRVKNKWKCTLKDGVMSVSGREWVFHKGMGEFEW